LSHVEGQPGEVDRFVWQKAGRDRYEKLLGLYVTPPAWVIRFARFQGDVAERAEEYQVDVDGSGRVFRVNHNLPEARPGENLTEDEARGIARAALDEPTNFKEVSATAGKRPARTDWTFVFKDTRDYGLPEGEPRISIEVAGDQVADTARYVYVPEEWSRNERRQRNLPTIFGLACTIAVVAIVVGGAVVGVIHWSRKRAFSSRTFFTLFGILFLLGAVNIVNSWPALAAEASTAQPLALQGGIIIVTSLVAGLFTAAALALVAGLASANSNASQRLPLGRSILPGVSVGLVLAGAGALARNAAPSMSPFGGNLAAASMLVPAIGAAIGPLTAFFTQTLVLLSVMYAFDRRPRAAALWIIVGIAVAGSSGIETIPSWLIAGATTGLLLMIAYTLVFRHRRELLLISTATLAILSTIRDGLQHAYPAALAGSIAAAILLAIAQWVWFRTSATVE